MVVVLHMQAAVVDKQKVNQEPIKEQVVLVEVELVELQVLLVTLEQQIQVAVVEV